MVDQDSRIEELTKRIRQLEAALEDAITDLSWWGEQSDRSVQEEYHLDDTLKYYLAVWENKQ